MKPETPFVQAMSAALKNRLEAQTLSEKREAEGWIAAIIRANVEGDDLFQFIPKADDEPEALDVKVAAAGPDRD
jgi:hypothetical protein